MKNLLPVVAMLLLSIGASAQIYVPAKPTIYGEQTLRAKSLIVQHIPFTNDPQDTALNTTDTTPQIKVIGGILKYHSGRWRTVGEGVNGTNGGNGGFTSEGATNIYITQPGTGMKLAYQVNDSTFGMRTIDFGNGFIIDTTDYTTIRIGYQGNAGNGGNGGLDTLAIRDANTVFAAPDGRDGTPEFRRLVEDDLPFISELKVTNLIDDLASKLDTTKTITINGNTQLVRDNPVFFIDTSKTAFDTTSLSARIDDKLNIKDTTGKWLPIGTVIPQPTDTTSLSARIDTKLNAADTTNKWIPIGTVFPSSNFDTTSLSNRIDDKLPKSTHIPKDITLTTVGQQGASTLDTATGVLNIPNYFFAVTTDSSNIDYSFTSMTTIYNEKGPGEYFANGHGVTVNADNTLHVFKQVKSLDVSGWNTNDYVSFKNSFTANATAYTFLRGFIYLKQVIPTQQSITVEFFNNGASVSKGLSIVNYGLNKNQVGSYMNITIPMSAFNFTSNSFDEIRFIFGGGSSSEGLYLDLVQFQNATEKENAYVTDIYRIPGTLEVRKTVNGQDVFAYNDSINPAFDSTSMSIRIDRKLDAVDTTNKWLPIGTVIPPPTDTFFLRQDISSLFNRNLTINGVTQNLTQDRTWTIPTADTSFLRRDVNDLYATRVPNTRTLTINGVAQDLSVNRTWTIPVGEPVIAAGTTLDYWRGDKTWQILNTTVVPEGANQYYTNARARAALSLTTSGTANSYDATTGVINIANATIPNLQQVTDVGNFTTKSLTSSNSFRVVEPVSFNELVRAASNSDGTHFGGTLSMKSLTTNFTTLLLPPDAATTTGFITFPDKSGTVALIGDIPAASPNLSGNTITINGNSQTLGSNPVFNVQFPTPSLDDVVHIGQHTTLGISSDAVISAHQFQVKESGVSNDIVDIQSNGFGDGTFTGLIKLKSRGNNYGLIFGNPDLTDNQSYTLPNKSGTIALLDDITGGGGTDISGNTITINGNSQTLGSNPVFNVQFPASRFGIEDNTTDAGRSVDMSNNSFNMYNSSNFNFSTNFYDAYISGSQYGLSLESQQSGIELGSDNIHIYTNYNDAMDIDPSSHIRFNQYGSGLVTGNATYGLGVDINGNVIETAIGGGGNNTININGNIQNISDNPVFNLPLGVRFGVEDNTATEDRIFNLGTNQFSVNNVNGDFASAINVGTGSVYMNAQFGGNSSSILVSNNQIYLTPNVGGNVRIDNLSHIDDMTEVLAVNEFGDLYKTTITGGNGTGGANTNTITIDGNTQNISNNPVFNLPPPVRFGVEDASPQEDRTINFNQHYLSINNLNIFGINVSDQNGSIKSGIGSDQNSATMFSGLAQVNVQNSGDVAINAASNNEVYLGFYGAGNKQFPATYSLGVTSNGMVVEIPVSGGGGTGGGGGGGTVFPTLNQVALQGNTTTSALAASGFVAQDPNTNTPNGSFAVNGGRTQITLGDANNNQIFIVNSHQALQILGGLQIEYEDNSSAKAAGLEVGTFYRTQDNVKIVH